MFTKKAAKRFKCAPPPSPADFNDSYHFVSRYDKLIRKGNAEPPIKDFVLITDSGTDTTQAVLETKGFKLFEFVRDAGEVNTVKAFSVVFTMAKGKHFPVFFITSDYDALVARVQQMGIAADVTVLK